MADDKRDPTLPFDGGIVTLDLLFLAKLGSYHYNQFSRLGAQRISPQAVADDYNQNTTTTTTTLRYRPPRQ